MDYKIGDGDVTPYKYKDKAIEVAISEAVAYNERMMLEGNLDDIVEVAIQAYEAAKGDGWMDSVRFRTDSEMVIEVYDKIINATKSERMEFLRKNGTTVRIIISPTPPSEA